MIILFLFLFLFIGINIRYVIILGIIEALLALGFVFYRFGKKVASISLIFLLLGVGLSFIRFDFKKEAYSSLVTEVKENYFIVSSSFEKLYVYEKDHPYEVGDILNISGYKKDLDFTSTESSFDFTDYLNRKGIYYELVPKEVQVKFKTPFKINQLKKKFLSHFDSDTQSMVRQLLFGTSDSGETTALLKEMHLIRIASTSGLFLNLIFSLICYYASRLLKKDKYGDMVGVCFLLLYSVFTYPRFIVIKFVVLNIFKWVNNYLLNKKFAYIELLSFTGLFFLLFYYHLAYQDAFLLAYFLPILLLFTNGSFRKVRKYKKKMITLLIIQLAMVPFIIKFNNEISPLSTFFQILMSPLLILYYCGSWICFIGVPLYKVMNGLTWFINRILSFFSPLLFKIYVPPIGDSFTFLYELLVIIIIYFWSIKNWDILKIVLTAYIAISVLYILPIKNYINTTISFIDVGQGDSCLISRGATSILIDTGGNIYHDLAKETLIPYFKKNRIYDIDLLITTHDDYDHMGAASSLIDNFKVKRYVTDYLSFPITVGDIILTNYNVYPELWKEENDRSLVVGFTLKDYEFLIMGDAPIKIEREIIQDNPDLHCDVLKVGHHGSNTSSSEEFIKQVKPSIAIISCGKNNKYGHPHKNVLSILNRYNVTIRRTDLEGTIKFIL